MQVKLILLYYFFEILLPYLAIEGTIKIEVEAESQSYKSFFLNCVMEIEALEIANFNFSPSRSHGAIYVDLSKLCAFLPLSRDKKSTSR